MGSSEDPSPLIVLIVLGTGMLVGGLLFGILGATIGGVLAVWSYFYTLSQLAENTGRGVEQAEKGTQENNG